MFDNSKVSDITPIKPGPRVEGIELTSIAKNEDRSVSFSFVGEQGATLVHREFAPKRIESPTRQTDEEFTKSINMSVSRIAHIARAFLTEEEFLAISKGISDEDNLAYVDRNWDAYLKATAMALGVSKGTVAKAKGIKCALKVVYKHVKSSGKHYSSLPMVPPFISTPNHPKTFSTNPQYDLYEMPSVKPDVETNRGGGGGTPTPTTEKGNFSATTAPSEHESGF